MRNCVKPPRSSPHKSARINLDQLSGAIPKNAYLSGSAALIREHGQRPMNRFRAFRQRRILLRSKIREPPHPARQRRQRGGLRKGTTGPDKAASPSSGSEPNNEIHPHGSCFRGDGGHRRHEYTEPQGAVCKGHGNLFPVGLTLSGKPLATHSTSPQERTKIPVVTRF